MTSNVPEGPQGLWIDPELKRLIESICVDEVDPCELLEPVMRGVMAKELAEMVLPGKEGRDKQRQKEA